MTLCVMGFKMDDHVKSFYTNFLEIYNYICYNCYNPESEKPTPICPECLDKIKNSKYDNMWPEEIEAYNEIIYYLYRNNYIIDELNAFEMI